MFLLHYKIVLIKLQAALVIRGFAIRGFDYSRTRKQGKIANREEKTQF